jgi:hypothetical protein
MSHDHWHGGTGVQMKRRKLTPAERLIYNYLGVGGCASSFRGAPGGRRPVRRR